VSTKSDEYWSAAYSDPETNVAAISSIKGISTFLPTLRVISEAVQFREFLSALQGGHSSLKAEGDGGWDLFFLETYFG